MKVVGFTALHYGRDYLRYAIASIIDHIDEYHVAYSAIGSHGHRTQIRCPETRDELYSIASEAAGSKLRWHDGEWPYEGAQRDSIHQYAPDADVIIVLDADEIWHPELIKWAVNPIDGTGETRGQRIRVGMIHYWRSFHRAIIHDPAIPTRIIYPKVAKSEGALDSRHIQQVISHFGYAQRPEIVKYKLETHGHRNEIRHDVDWFNDVYMNVRRKNDLHLVGSEYWNYESINPWDYLPAFMKEHEYAYKDIIE